MPPAPIPSHVPEHRVHRFDFRDQDGLRHDPWTYLAGMSDLPDIFFSPDLGGYWVVTRAALIDEVFCDHERFTATSLAIPRIENPMTLIPNHFDPPRHGVYRKLMANGMFSPRALATLEPDTRRLTLDLFDGFAPGTCEFVHDFAYRLPIDIFLELMGADAAYRDECLHFIKLVFRGTTLAQTTEGFVAANAFVTRWLDAQVAAPAANAGPMFQAMLAARIEGRPLNVEEMRAITMMLFMGGLDTITSQMTHIMRFLAESPGHRQALIDRPETIPVALEELLRRFGISYIGRAVATDFTWRGVELRRGDAVCAATPIAGLDRRAFPDPLVVDFDRAGAGRRVKHLGFGSGPHLCIGAHLARVQLTVMLQELLPRMPGLRVAAGHAIENLPGSTMMLKALPLQWNC
ncbi:cytochrome P450 [Sphingomonas sp. RP10(2022)]|uniref:Cytochrome P450 n=1 Tax=Sphingomonas liriopis TaxID=2949094 RepID=A0A9X2KRB7_9SPHN|nr:cytochrome P450 [Sphingomonas liriopis]MCP3735897.1 cytochrome P450 [Sphingomonas liriopis]